MKLQKKASEPEWQGLRAQELACPGGENPFALQRP